MAHGTTRARRTSGHFHAVRFYQDADGLSHIVADFLGDGLVAGQPAVVIATPRHRAGIERHMTQLSIDVDDLQHSGRLFLLDAHTMMAAFMVDGMPDAERFRRTMIPVLERACRHRTDCVVRAYGEMVDVLWKARHTAAAIRLETLWNMLANTQAFSLLCGYGMGSFYKPAVVADICRHHTHVVSARGEATPIA